MKRKHEPTPEQKAKAQERRQRFFELCKTIASMSDDQRATFALNMPVILKADGMPLSAFNTMLICYQHPTATVVMGYKQWQEQNRHVRKGESALAIWKPIFKNHDDSNADQPTGDDLKAQNYIMVSVFDISQTEPGEIQP